MIHDKGGRVMRPALAVGLAAAMLLAACGSSASSPDATTDTTSAPTPTEAPPENSASGQPAGWDADGEVSFQVVGIPSPFSDALGYSSARSFFGGDAQTFLSFTNDSSDDTLIVQVTDGAVVIQYAGTGITIPSAECKVPDLKLDAALSSGTFDCTASTATDTSGSTYSGARISGSFEAHG